MLIKRNAFILILLAAVLMFISVESRAGTSNSLMDISADGKLLACSNRDSGTLTIIDLQTHKKLREFRVGEEPEGVSFIGETHEVAVRCICRRQSRFPQCGHR